MTKVYLHAGPARTGTTAIQSWLVRNADALLERGVFTFQNTDFAHQFAVEAITNPDTKARPDIPTFQVPPEGVDKELKRAAEDEHISRIVISSECLSVANPSLVQQRLSELQLDDVTVIMVLRRQDRVIESGYSQVVKYNGWTIPIGRPHYVKDFDWYLLASRWAHAVGHQNVVLHLYDNIGATDQSIVAQLFHGVDAFLTDFATSHSNSAELANPSLPAALIEFNRLANQVGARSVLSLLEKASRLGIGGPPFRMAPDVAKGFLDCYRETNQKLAKEFFHRDGDLFDESDLESDTGGADYTHCLPAETLAMLFALYVQEQAEQK